MGTVKFVNCAVLSLCVLLPGQAYSACVDDHPMVSVSSIGGGQRASVNETLTATFKGHITTTVGLVSHGRNVVKICPGTTVEYVVSSTTGEGLRAEPECVDRFHMGALAAGDKLICNNTALGGSDSDSYTIKEGS